MQIKNNNVENIMQFKKNNVKLSCIYKILTEKLCKQIKQCEYFSTKHLNKRQQKYFVKKKIQTNLSKIFKTFE